MNNVWLRDLDGTGSLHPCMPDDEGAIEFAPVMQKHQIFDLPMDGENDTGAKTVREYLLRLLMTLIEEGESFSGKRPFGNSDWDWDLAAPLGIAGLIDCEIDDDGEIMNIDTTGAMRKIAESIKLMIEREATDGPISKD